MNTDRANHNYKNNIIIGWYINSFNNHLILIRNSRVKIMWNIFQSEKWNNQRIREASV